MSRSRTESGFHSAKCLKESRLETILHGAPLPDLNRPKKPGAQYHEDAAMEAKALIERANKLWAEQQANKQP